MTRRRPGVHGVGIVCSPKAQPQEMRASRIFYAAKQRLSVRGCGSCPQKMFTADVPLSGKKSPQCKQKKPTTLLTEYYVLGNLKGKVSHDGKAQHKPTRYKGGPSLCLRFLLNMVVPPDGSLRSTTSSPSSAIFSQ